ncbi:unnamed protein product [Cylindrotheca closterium]|uniref:Uncharacterized protein n=1 Tax=Cylindrotheca closterium TaxID=2856 RepID=A0AAD2FDV2_9STRA|nr:unnamed protein product [Cylindrotheca closterium]
MAEDEMERLVNRLDELEKKSNAEISNLKENLKQAQEKNEASELKLGELEQRVAQQSQDDQTFLLSSNSNSSQANRGTSWHVIGNNDQASSNAFKQPQFTLPTDLCSVFCATSWKGFPFWLSALIIAGLQVSLFVLLLIDRVGSKRWVGFGAECDESDGNDIYCRHERPLGMPTNVEPLVRAAQALCLVFALYDQQGVFDGLEGFFAGMPVDYKGSTNFRNMTLGQWNLSFFLRFLQGFLGVLCAFVLLVQAETVFDVLLNFLGVKFISEMDKVAFHIGLKGYFGTAMQEAAEDVAGTYFRREEDTRPWGARNIHVIIMMGMLAVLIAWFAHLAILQTSGTYLVRHFHVDFGKDPLLSLFNGCYSASDDGLLNSRLSYSQIGTEAKFGFCKKTDKSENGGWTLYFGSSPCPSDFNYNEVLAISEPTESFDLPLVDPTKWSRQDGYNRLKPVEVVHIDDYRTECYDSAVAREEPDFDSKCLVFNATYESRQKTFEMLVTEPSAEYPCRDPTTCRPIYVSKPDGPAYSSDVDIIYYTGQFWANSRATRDLEIEYSGEDVTKDDIRNFFYKGDGFKIVTNSKYRTTRYITLPDGGFRSPIYLDWYEPEHQYITYYNSESEYLFYYLPYANLEKEADLKFECVGDYTDAKRRCFENEFSFGDATCLCNEPIPDAFDLSTPRGMAVQDIKNDRRAIEMCAEFAADDSSLVVRGLIQERYALAVVKNTFGIESQGWDGNSCTSWLGDTVELKCDNQTSVQQLIFLDSDTVKHSGTIPPEMQLLSNLEHLDLGQNAIRGHIPEQIGFLGALTYLDLFDCSLTGVIPGGLGYLYNLKSLYLSENKLSGQIPNFGHLENLEVLSMYNNSLSGTIPAEMEANVNLTCFAQGNSITGTSKVCQL